MKFRLYTDGASKGNPGPAGIGIVIEDEGGNVVEEISEYAGIRTNNEAEYLALIRGLERCRERGADEVEIFSDSQLLVRQLSGRYKVKSPKLQPLYERVKLLMRGFKKVSIHHVLRKENFRADVLASRAVRRSSQSNFFDN